MMKRILALLLVVTMGCTLTPANVFASPDGSPADADPAVPQTEQFESGTSGNESYTEGEALVLYHAGTASGLLSSSGDESQILTSAGFSVSETLDFSAVDEAGSSLQSSEENEADASSADIPSGADLRIAVIKSDTLNTEDLVSQLDSLSCVECAQPNYTHELSDLPETAEESAILTFPTEDMETAESPASASADAQAASDSVSAAADDVPSFASSSPDDPLYQSGLQWGLADSSAGVDLPAALKADAASSVAEDNIVAVLDTGVDYTNPDLAGKMWKNPGNIGLPGLYGYDFAQMDDDPMPGRGGEHGTHCAGLAAAQSDNGTGVASAARHTKIMALKGSWDDGNGPFDIACIRSYQYIITAKLAGQNVKVITNSWLIGSYAPVLDYVINQAGKAGILSLFAAGNENKDTLDDYEGAPLSVESPYAVVVGASNQQNKLVNFSNYDSTAVDVASPGASMLSTVPVSSETNPALYDYDPMVQYLNHETGAVYTNQLGDLLTSEKFTNLNCHLFHVNSSNRLEAMTESDAAHFSITEEDADGLRTIRVRVSGLNTLSDSELWNYRIYYTWTEENPLYGLSAPASDYVSGVSCIPFGGEGNESKYAEAGFAVGTSLSEINSLRNYSFGTASTSHKSSLDGAIPDTVLSSNTLSCILMLMMEQPADGGTEVTARYSIAGITKKSDISAYGFMSGTSMATPFLAGCCAELASLYPDESPLELRGRLVGGTVPMADAYSSEGAKKAIACQGHFSFDKALDTRGSASDSAINASTWSISCSGNVITVSGYGLGDASLYVDETTHQKKAAVTSQDEDSIVFTAGDALFDGGKHRFDVVDSSTGRTYNASYTVPEKNSSTLVRIGELPGSDTEMTSGVLVAGSDRIFFADQDGEFLYSCTDPSSASSASSWTKLSSAEKMIEGCTGLPETMLRYAYRNGKLYAFNADVRETDGKEETDVFCSEYDIGKNTWSGVKKIGTFDVGRLYENEPVFFNTAAYSAQGKICLIMTEDFMDLGTGNALTSTVFFLDPDSDEFQRTEIPISTIGKIQGITGYFRNGTTDYFTAVDAGQPSIVTLAYDGSSWKNLGILSGEPEWKTETCFNQIRYVRVNTGNGILQLGPDTFSGIGDTVLVDPVSMTWKGLGTSLGTSVSEIIPTGAAMLGGKVYVAGLEGNAGTFYTLPDSLAGTVTTTDITVSVNAEQNGNALISVGGAAGSSKITMRSGDTAVLTATVPEGCYLMDWIKDGIAIGSGSPLAIPLFTSGTITARYRTSPYSRIYGATRYDTMAAAVKSAFPDGSSTVIVASGENWPDALAASSLAGVKDCPVILTEPDQLTKQTSDLLTSLKVSDATIIGGTAAVSDDVKAAIEKMGIRTDRIGGDDRMQTAEKVEEEIMKSSSSDTIIISSGQNFPDALSISSYAYAQKDPILLTGTDGKLTGTSLTIAKKFRNAVIVGKEGAVSGNVETQLSGAAVKRYGGSDRYGTSLEIINGLFGGKAAALAVSTGSSYPDSLVSAALSGKSNGAILLIDGKGTSLTENQKTVLKNAGSVWILGGDNAVSAVMKTSIDSALR